MPNSPFRPLLRRLLRLVALTAVLACAIGRVTAAETGAVLRVLAWPGYADPDVVREFERRTGVRVQLTLVSSDDVLWQKVSARDGSDFDVFAANTAELQRYIDSGLAVPLDLQLIPNTRRQLPRFRDLAGIRGLVREDAVYGVPYTYAEMGLIYDRARFPQPPDSINVLWDPRYRGQVLAYDGGTHNFSLAQLALSASPFHIDPGGWPRAVDQLIALRRNVLTFYSEPAESVELFLRHQAAILFANYGAQQLQLLQQAGANVGYAIPKEGALAWLDCWAITRGARDRALASAWINYTLEESVSSLLITRQGLSSTRVPSSHHSASDKLLWLEPVEDVGRRSILWNHILSGDSRERVLAP